MFARYTGSEAATAVRSVSGLDGVESWCRFYASYNRITFGLVLRVPRQWYVLTVARDAIHLKHTIMQWEDEWNKNVVTELSSDTRVSDLWRMSALLETVPRKSGSRYCCGWTKSENTIRTVTLKVISYPTNHFERSCGGNTDTSGPMDIISVDRNVERERSR